jgi:hypothetical protein
MAACLQVELQCCPDSTLALMFRHDEASFACAGALWNLGLEPDGRKALRAAGVPPYLRQPVAVTWLASDNDVTNLPGFGAQRAKAALPAFHPTWDLPLHLLDASA